MGAAEQLSTDPVSQLLHSWGFLGSASQQVMEHALNVLRYRDQPIGKIVSGLEIAAESRVEELLRHKPERMKTLAYLRECDEAIARRHDEVLAVHNGICYISNHYPGLALHPQLSNKDVSLQLHNELTKRNAMAVQILGGSPMILFSDIEKLFTYKALSKRDRNHDTMTRLLVNNGSPDQLKVGVMSNTLELQFRQLLMSADESSFSNGESSQTITQDEGDGNPTIRTIVTMLNAAITQGVNDVQIRPEGSQSSVLFRKNQRLRSARIVLKGDERDEVVRLLLSRSGANKGASRLLSPADGNMVFIGKLGQAFLRLSFIPLESSNGEAISVSIRVLPRSAKKISMDSLNIRPDIQVELKRLLRRKYGLIVVCGPTGSGKSTTIGGMLCEHNDIYGESQKRLSVEEPVERILPGVLHIDVSQHSYTDRKGGESTNKFAMALRSLLRHDPDVLFVGEVRDKESCMVSVDSANTGHLVFTTTHANDPVLGYRRLASFLPADRRYDLVNVVEAILAQRLVTTLCPHCSKEAPVTPEELDDLEFHCMTKGIPFSRESAPTHHMVCNPEGCQECVDGYQGMVPVHGLLVMTPEIRRLLLSNDDRDLLKAQETQDKYSVFGAAFDLYRQGKIDLQTVMI